MKRRTFLKGLAAFIAAPLAVFGVKKYVYKSGWRPHEGRSIEPEIKLKTWDHLTDNEAWFLKDPANGAFGLAPIKAEGEMINYDPMDHFEKAKHRKLWKQSTH